MSETIILVKELLKELYKVYQEYAPDVTFYHYPEELMLVCNDATIFFVEEESMFYVTFLVGVSAAKAAAYVKIIGLVLQFSEYTILDDSYFDKDQNRLVFGLEAYESRNCEIRKLKQQCKCPVCEAVYHKRHFKDGYCLNCHDNLDQINWQ